MASNEGVKDEHDQTGKEETVDTEGDARASYNPGGLLRVEPPPFCGASPEPLKK